MEAEDRVILHCDCNAFYASVELLSRPDLRDKPVAVCGDPANRHGIILAKNEHAKRFGVKTAETIWQARRKCPSLVLLPPHHELYKQYSERIYDIYARYTDQIEPFGLDEAWLDVTASQRIFGDGKMIADTLRRVVREETGLTISVGVSFNKVFAKVGSDYQKPDATTVLLRENYHNIIDTLPVSALLFVGASCSEILARLGIETVGELARCDVSLLRERLGRMGTMLHEYANGRDISPVTMMNEKRIPKSVGNGMTFRRDILTHDDALLALRTLAERVGIRLRRRGMQCRTLQLTVRDDQFRTRRRQTVLELPTSLSEELAEAAGRLLDTMWTEGLPIRMLTITGTRLVFDADVTEQISFFEEKKTGKRSRQMHLAQTLDSVRVRYGKDAVCPAVVLGNDMETRPVGDGEEEQEYE